ncbi:FlhC family transcriptional regulator [Photobacterium ganghwense]|uniref:FlhC family transcriptional regulator n=1 Tax=Photobacterium ganghwense TaxID=320778 RepID=UPI001A8FB2BD|nr:FlhC family transcriptional regulator [Photobacterium ganghwense]QSV17520.1 hypothetical protein FH974_25785 [Photobacterium ganghwense]
MTVRTSHQAENELLARKMLKAGFTTRTVVIETGLPDKRIRTINKLFDEATLARIKLNRKSHSTRTHATLLQNKRLRMHLSAGIRFYLRLLSDDLDTAMRMTKRRRDIDCLMKAYSAYRSCIKDIDGQSPELATSSNIVKIDINDFWSIVRDMSEEIVTMKKCSDCGCSHLVSERHIQTDCPFCSNTRETDAA